MKCKSNLRAGYKGQVGEVPDSFKEARKERLKVSGNPSQYDELEVFIREQDLWRKLAKESLLPTLEIDISDDHIPGAVEKIADWLEETGACE